MTRNERRAYKKRIGECTECKNPAQKGKVKCQYHIEKQTASKIRCRKKKKVKLCTECDSPAIGSLLKCKIHSQSIKERAKIRAKENYKKDREKIIKRSRNYYWQNKEKVRLKSIEFRKNHKELLSMRSKKYFFDNKDEILLRSKIKQQKLKILALKHYSNNVNPYCACCGRDGIIYLTLDHIDNSGNTHRKSGITNLYSWIKKNKFPTGFQVLCWSCNMGKHLNHGQCPHKGITPTVSAMKSIKATNHAIYRNNLKILAMLNYGNGTIECSHCKDKNLLLLTIDHIDNNGNEHRESEGKKFTGVPFYIWLRNNNFPEGYQVLCWSCNAGKHINGGKLPD